MTAIDHDYDPLAAILRIDEQLLAAVAALYGVQFSLFGEPTRCATCAAIVESAGCADHSPLAELQRLRKQVADFEAQAAHAHRDNQRRGINDLRAQAEREGLWDEAQFHASALSELEGRWHEEDRQRSVAVDVLLEVDLAAKPDSGSTAVPVQWTGEVLPSRMPGAADVGCLLPGGQQAILTLTSDQRAELLRQLGALTASDDSDPTS